MPSASLRVLGINSTRESARAVGPVSDPRECQRGLRRHSRSDEGEDNLALTFNDGAIDVAAGKFRARVTLAATAQREVRLSIFINPGEPAIVITIALDSLLPPFIDLIITSAEIRKDGLIVSLGPGGADPPSK